MRVAVTAFVALSLAACGELPSAPAPSFSGVPQGTSAVCHFTPVDGGTYTRIDVASNALAAHLAHGDGVVGADYPGPSGFIFAANCTAEAVPSGGDGGVFY
jgi:hypothetical protein